MKLRSTVRPALGSFLGAFFVHAVVLAQPAPPGPPPGSPPSPPPPVASPPPPPMQAVPPLAGPPTQPGPPPGWQGQPPPLPPPPGTFQPAAGGWQPPPPMDPEQPPPEPPSEGKPAKSLPVSQRGGIFLDAAGLLVKDETRDPLAAFGVRASIPVSDRTFVEGTLPFVFGALANPMLGVRHVYQPGDKLWITAHGAFGFPLVNIRNFDNYAAARGFWDMQEYAIKMVPFALGVGVEWHASIVELRAEMDPNFGISIASKNSHHFAFQHAFEVQLGHTIGGGLRYQGVAFGTETNPANGDDHYQGAFEPFFAVNKKPLVFRLGILLPVDDELGKPFDHTWGMRATTGWTFD
ncbi:MAG: hypothetical protein U0359_02385 [Byssovorax sp.]